ncbi:MAG: serine/threonine-protein kinase [Planctomycetaceae bacterium]
MSTKHGEHKPARRRPFRDLAAASGLVAAADLDAAEAAARDRLSAEAESAAAESDGEQRLGAATAAVLVEQGKLTPFQSREILAGRTRFRLGQYTVIDEIGRGGMGQVFKAEHALMGRQVAVKVLPRSKATPESEAAFRREMRILGRLDHESLVRAFDAGYDAMVYYLVTEFVPGMDLRRIVRAHGPLDAATAASVFSQVARGLAFAHGQGVVHRDVKPGNILVMEDGRVKVLDLGLAGSTLEAEAVRLGRVVGTMDYIAPEQIRTPDDVGPPADIYALGCSMYYALTGEMPFPGGTRKEKMRRHLAEAPVPIARLAPDLPPQLCQLVEAMMAKSVADRIGSAEEVVRRLARWTPDRPVAPTGRSPAPPVVAPPAGDSWGGDRGAQPAWPVLEAAASKPPPLVALRAGDDDPAVLEESLAVLSRAASVAAQVLVPAVAAGVGFAIVLMVVRGIDRRGFAELLGPVSPTACGWVAFLFVAAVQAAGKLGRRHR